MPVSNPLTAEIAATTARIVVEEDSNGAPPSAAPCAKWACPPAPRCLTTTRWKTRCANTSTFSVPTPSHASCAPCASWRWCGWCAWPSFGRTWRARVWHGTATRLSDIYIQLFCDDPKSAEIALIDHHVDYEPRTVTGFHGESVEALSLGSECPELQEMIGVHLMISRPG